MVILVRKSSIASIFFSVVLSIAPIAFAAGDVSMKEDGDAVTLANGVITVAVSKSKASVASLKFRGIDMLTTGYFSMDGGTDYRTPGGCKFFVKTNSPDIVDIGMKRIWTNEPQVFDIEMHYVLRRGDSGVYVYALLDHPASYADGGYGEWRFVWKLNDDTLEKIYADDTRHWLMANSKDTREITGIKEITKLTSGVRAGQYDCKYDYSVSYYDMGAWGHASDKNKVGAFIVLGSQEFFNDGPTKQDLNAASGINHIHFGMNHYNSSGVHVPKGQAWQKLYGPFLLYCNTAPNADACWDDAKSKVKSEHAAWPYSWLTNTPAYPPEKDRSMVSGTFAVTDSLVPAVKGPGAWVGLAKTEAGGNWQFESYNYQFWTKSGVDGSFKIPHVRPDTYTLYAFTDGEVGEFSKADVTVSAGKPLDLGKVTWTPPHRGARIAWEIGTPDRTAREFLLGDDYFHGYVWQKFPSLVSNPLEYTIGRSTPRNMPFAHTRYAETGPANRWNIHFDLPAAPRGDATLVAAIASADHAGVAVLVNDQKVGDIKPKVSGGNAMLRESIHAKYCVEYVTVPAASLKAGANTLSLSLPTSNNAGAHIMYDYLSLELP